MEDVLAQALERVLRLGEAPRLTVAGRTDAGVHARGQVAHADVPADAWSAGAGAILRRLALREKNRDEETPQRKEIRRFLARPPPPSSPKTSGGAGKNSK